MRRRRRPPKRYPQLARRKPGPSSLGGGERGAAAGRDERGHLFNYGVTNVSGSGVSESVMRNADKVFAWTRIEGVLRRGRLLGPSRITARAVSRPIHRWSRYKFARLLCAEPSRNHIAGPTWTLDRTNNDLELYAPLKTNPDELLNLANPAPEPSSTDRRPGCPAE